MKCWDVVLDGLSRRQVTQRYGLNDRHIRSLVAVGRLATVAGRIYGLKRLVEGADYVTCRACGSWVGQISTRHLRACSRMVLSDYVVSYPDAVIMCSLVVQKRAKTDEQKRAQSEKLKARFRTRAGEITRRQISENAKRVMDLGYREQAAEHLRYLNNTPEQRSAVSQKSRKRWAEGDMREVITRWHAENRSLSLRLAHNARQHIKKTFTKPHARLEEALLKAGVPVEREYSVRYYHVDEAVVAEKLAIEVDGCYWHGCSVCGFPAQPWTRALDRRRTTFLNRRGWTILRVRECEIKADLDACVERVTATWKALWMSRLG